MRRALAVAAAWTLAWAGTAQAAPPQVIASKQLTPRLTELTLRTPNLAADTVVRVLLPDGYSAAAKRRYPVLYLLHGCCDFDVRGSQAWTTHGEAEKATAGLGLIVVMPDAGAGGFYSDWFNGGAGGPPRWESYHIGQLIPFIDARYRTLAKREGRAVTGLSMGGFGALSYASRHPDLFVSAASFSGAVDTGDPVFGPVDDSLAVLDSGKINPIWGPRVSQEIRWRDHNPNDLANNMRGMTLTVRTGNGLPGGPFGGGPDPIEIAVHQQSTTLHKTLVALHMSHVWEDYGPGSHAWPYWARDLRETLPSIMNTFAHPPGRPQAVDYKTAEPRYKVFGWRVTVDRPALEFSELADASRAGFTLQGSGSASVITPAYFRHGRSYAVTVTPQSGAARTSTVMASPGGRLHVTVPLGPGNPTQEYRPGSTTRVFKTVVTTSRSR